MELEVYTKEGTPAGRTVTLPDEIFGIEPNEHAVYLAVKAQLTNMRQGTRKTKGRSEVSGGGRKPWKQKGRGTARAGSTRSPIWRHGGTVHGPQPQDFEMKVPKKVKRLARISVLSQKVKAQQVKIVEDFKIEEPKTKHVAGFLRNFNLYDQKTLMLLPEYDPTMLLAGRNIKTFRMVKATDASTYDLLNCKTLLITEGAVEKLKEALA
ncbi:MAG: 50S ribosomal protein L4 [candidate division KSB1 bacterium]|nr:50S ribosomal protein L4 [candidate division KSB1 bacterium]